MIVKVFENEEFAGRAAADAIIAQISAKPNSVLGLPTGSTPVPTYRRTFRSMQRKDVFPSRT